MVNHHKVAGYEAFVEYMQKLKSDDLNVNVYFTGSKDTTGNSWCPDCNVAWPVVEEALNKVSNESHFVYVDVGDRAFWKDMKNPFRTDKTTHLSVIPSLLRWKGPQRLEGDQLNSPDLLDMFFNDD